MNTNPTKREQEESILEMVYDTDSLDAVSESERPDFRLRIGPRAPIFGVEITQLFQSDSHARLALSPGYVERLWNDGDWIHKRDPKVLDDPIVTLQSKDPSIPDRQLRVVLWRHATPSEYRARLLGVLQTKAAKKYPMDGLSHINLAILDWFTGGFDATDYPTATFLDDDIRAELLQSPFQEVFLIKCHSPSGRDSTRPPRLPEPAVDDSYPWRYIPLQQLLLLESFMVAGASMAANLSIENMAPCRFNELIVSYLARFKGIGEPVRLEDQLYLRYRASLICLGESGPTILDLHDAGHGDLEPPDRINHIGPHAAARLRADAHKHGFACSHSVRARRPKIWQGPE